MITLNKYFVCMHRSISCPLKVPTTNNGTSVIQQ